jgi:hypothetical protein
MENPTELDYINIDRLLEYKAKYPRLKTTEDYIKDQPEFRSMDNINQIITTLINYGIFRLENCGMYDDCVMITELGKVVARNGGFEKFHSEQVEKEISIKKREELEIKHLNQTVRINSYQFWFMMIGAAGGIVTFLILVYQFLFGTAGFFNS